jgi:hypothetical protein
LRATYAASFVYPQLPRRFHTLFQTGVPNSLGARSPNPRRKLEGCSMMESSAAIYNFKAKAARAEAIGNKIFRGSTT